MRMGRVQLILLRFGLGLAGGALLGLCFRVTALGVLAYLGPVPWILLATHPKLRDRWLVTSVSLGCVVWFLLALEWYFTFSTAVGVVTGLFSPIVYVPFLLVLRRCARRFAVPLTFLVPVAWVGWEILRPFTQPGRFSVAMLGHSQIGFIQMVQIADIFGVAGISFLVAMGSGLIADLLYRFAPIGQGARPPWRRVGVAGAAFLAFYLLAYFYGVVRLNQDTFRPGPRLALIQSATPHDISDRQTSKSGSTAQREYTIEQVPSGSVEMSIWPENAIMDMLYDDPQYLGDIEAVVRATGADLLVSAFRWDPEDPTHGFNSVFHFDRQGREVGVYDKVRLIPLAEYLPFEGLVRRIGPDALDRYRRFARRLIGWDSIGQPGRDGIVVFELEGPGGPWSFGAPTCYENTHPQLARSAVRKGADFLVNMTSEGTVGPLASSQFYLVSAFRAIEHRVGVARVGNIGITGFIDPNGMPQETLSAPGGALYGYPGVLIGRVTLDSRAGTIYTALGDWPAFAIALLAALLMWLPWPLRKRAAPGADEQNPQSAEAPPG